MKNAFKLDPFALQLVNRYADEFARNPRDIVNGIVTGQLEHAFEANDDSLDIIHEQVVISASARRKMQGS